MCKPYCVVYHCYLSSFPLNFVSIYKSFCVCLYIYIYRERERERERERFGVKFWV